jgi:hypothetical protein
VENSTFDRSRRSRGADPASDPLGDGFPLL